MTNVRAQLRYLRMSPRKVRLVVDAIRGKSVQQAEHILQFHPRLAARPVLKLLQSAIANAEHNFKLDRTTLTVGTVKADGGPTLKRYRPRAFGSAASILKRTTHITIILTSPEKKDAKDAEKKVDDKDGKRMDKTAAKKGADKKSASKTSKPIKKAIAEPSSKSSAKPAADKSAKGGTKPASASTT